MTRKAASNTRLVQYRCRPWPEWEPRQNMDRLQRRPLAPRSPPERYAQFTYLLLGIQREYP
jgi:hypothetical protein